jgi:hypothetical protein
MAEGGLVMLALVMAAAMTSGLPPQAPLPLQAPPPDPCADRRVKVERMRARLLARRPARRNACGDPSCGCGCTGGAPCACRPKAAPRRESDYRHIDAILRRPVYLPPAVFAPAPAPLVGFGGGMPMMGRGFGGGACRGGG